MRQRFFIFHRRIDGVKPLQQRSRVCARGSCERSSSEEGQRGNLARSIEPRWTEEQQVNVFEHQFVMLNNIPQVRGFVPWVLMDFRSSARNIPKPQDGFNRKGLIAEDGNKKLAFYLFRKTYKERSVGNAE